MAIDELDVVILDKLRTNPRISILELARLVGAARNTVYARLERLGESGVVTGYGPDVDLVSLGFPVTAFTTIEVAQGRFDEVVAALETMPAVLEAFTVAGPEDLFCRVVARTNDELMHTLERVLAIPAVERTSTTIALARSIPYRTHLLVAETGTDQSVAG